MSTTRQKMSAKSAGHQTGPPLPLTQVQRRIIGAVTRSGALTRADIARELRLSRSNLSPVIRRLINDGLLVTAGQGQSHGGRRGNLLAVGDADAAVLAGVEIDADRVRVVVTTLGMRVLAQQHAQLHVNDDPEGTLDLAARMITDSLESAYGPLVAIGVSLAAAIDVTTGGPLLAPAMPRWVGFLVGDYLADRFSTRVFTDSDLNALAFAEMIVPHRTPLGSAFLVVKAHEGIGCGIVINNTVFRGSDGSAGEMGHICVDPDDSTICACGRRGCLEAVVALPNLVARARELLQKERSPVLAPMLEEHGDLSMDLIGRATFEGDPVAVSLMRDMGMRIGFVLAGAISFFNPSSIVISTGRMLGSDVLLSAIRQGVYERAFPGATRRIQIVESGLGEDAVALGAAVLACEGLLGTAGKVAYSCGGTASHSHTEDARTSTPV
jgi:predicted NBD/HSP70 family sugar kinase